MRLSRLKNYVMFVDGVNEPPKHIEKLNDRKQQQICEKILIEAKEYIHKVRNDNALYDGAMKASTQNMLSKKVLNIYEIKNIFKKIISFYKWPKYQYDPQVHHPLTSLYYNYLYKKINNHIISFILKDRFVDEKFLDNNKYIFYPLHVEPELVLSQFARPYLNQLEVIRNIRYSTDLRKTILVKDHPLMYGKRSLNYYKKILSIPNVLLVNPLIPSERILNNCELLVIIRGAMGLEAVIKNTCDLFR